MENKTQPGNAAAKKGADAQTETHSENGRQKSLKQVFEMNLRDVYDAEKQLLKALPKMGEAAFNEDLQDTFADHLEQTRRHVERLDKIFAALGIEPGSETCEAMQGLIKETRETIAEFSDSDVRDTALIINAQKIEHYEIAAYGSLCELADVLGLNKIADLLDRTLNEEKEADRLLSEVARDVNDEAYAVSADGDKHY